MITIKQTFETRKLYFGFPVFFLGYKDDSHGYNITTSSSAYSLGSMMVIAMRTKSNAMVHILKYGEFTVNLPTRELTKEVEVAGFNSRKDKFALTDLTYVIGKTVDAPLVEECAVSIECQVVETVEYGALTNIVARITSRSVDSSLITEDGTFDSEHFYPISYLGDGSERQYRYYNDEHIKMGSIIKSLRDSELDD